MSEKKNSPESGFSLSSSQAWESLFQQEIPIIYQSETFRKYVHEVTQMYANIHLSYQLGMIHVNWLQFQSNEIDTKNTKSVAFTPGPPPYGPVHHQFLVDHHPESIEIMDHSRVKLLEDKLRDSRILKESGALAGEVLFNYRNPIDKSSTSAIGFGVIDRDTCVPEGIIFVPEGMFPYKKTGFSGKRKQGRQVVQVTKQPVLQPIGIPI
ncbi:MAG: hypothetical protein WAV40_02810 [Microgenomates group bacterium]